MMNIKCKKIAFLFFLLCGFTTINAQSDLALEEAIKIGLENNYNIQLSLKNQEIFQENNSLGEAGFLPNIDAVGSYNGAKQDAKLQFSDGGSINRKGAKSTNLNAAVELDWVIFDGTKMFITKNKLDELERSADLSLKMNIQNAVSAILMTYYQLSLEEKRLEVYQNITEVSKARVELAETKNALGSISNIELTKAKVDYNSDQSSLIRQEQNIRELKSNLNVLMARSAETDFRTIDTTQMGEPLAYETLKSKLFENTDLQLMEQNIKVAQYESKEIGANRLPTVRLNSAYSYNESTSEAGFVQSNQTKGITYGISASIPIFNGSSINRKKQISKLNLEQENIQYERFKNTLIGNFYVTYQLYFNNLKQIEFERESKELAKSNLNIALKNYEIGGISSFDLRDIQISSANAENRYLEALFNAKSAEIELLRITNQIAVGK